MQAKIFNATTKYISILKKIGFEHVPINPLYMVNNVGDVVYAKTGRLLKSKPDKRGYLKVVIQEIDGKQRYELIHRLVAMCFVGMPDGEKITVNHIDSNKQNNFYKNLEWVTYKYNEQHKRKFLNKSGFGETNPMAKITQSQADNIRLRLFNLKPRSLERKLETEKIKKEFNLKQPAISNIVNNKTYIRS